MDLAEAKIYLGERMCGRYLIREFLGSGAFAGVFEAVDEHADGVPVAVKILSIQAAQSPDARLEFDGERELLRALTGCSNVVTLLDADQHTMTLSANGVNFTVDASFLVLELAEASLAELLLDRRKISWSDRLQLFRDVAKGVHQMHLQRMVHRDAKADNALVFPQQPLAKVSDLGRSCRTDNPRRFPLEDYMIGRGDLRFAAPELVFCCGSDDPLAMARADIYLVGSALFEIGTGVGLTAAALGNPRQITARLARMPLEARVSEFRGRISEVRQRQASAYEIFRAELPSHLRNPATDLLRLLTDPDPTKRTSALRQRSADPWDLQWLLGRIDVLRKIDEHHMALDIKRQRRARSREAGRS